MKPKTAVILFTSTVLLLAARAGFLIYDDHQHDLRLKTAQSGLQALWEHFNNRVETPAVIVDDQPEASASIELHRLWGSNEQSQKEYRQEIIRLINEQRQVVNNQTPDVTPLLILKTHPTLEQSARQAFENINETKRFEHQDIAKLLNEDRLFDLGLVKWDSAFDRVGENLAAENYVNPVKTVYDWYLSESHKEIMLGDWEFIGVWSGWVENLVIEGEEPQDHYVTVAHFGE